MEDNRQQVGESLVGEVKAIVVTGTGNHLQVLPTSDMPVVVVIAADPDNALELVRVHFEKNWGANVHALRWIVPRDLLLPTDDPGPFLVLHGDKTGSIPVRSDGASRAGDHHKMDAVLQEASHSSPFQPWSEPKWLAETSGWLATHLGFGGLSDYFQVRALATGSVLRIQSASGSYFLKTLPFFIAYEADLVRFLASNIPGAGPTVLPMRPDPTSYIMSAVDGVPLATIRDVRRWQAAVRELARIQIMSVDHTHAMSVLGVPKHSFAMFAANVAEIVSSLTCVQKGLPNQLLPFELDQLQGMVDRARVDAEVLHRCCLPDSIVHGDPSEHNIYVRNDGGTTLIDWAYSRISHPFFVFKRFSAALRSPKHRMSAAFEAVKAAYIEPWQRYVPLDRLEKGIEAAARLAWIESAQLFTSVFQLLRKHEPGNFMQIPEMLRRCLLAYGITRALGRQ